MKINPQRFCKWQLLFFFMVILFAPMQTLEAKTKLNIALVADGEEAQTNNVYFDIAKKEIISLLQNDYDVYFSARYFAQWDLNSAQQALQKALNDKSVNIVVATGFLTSQATLKLKKLNKPVFATVLLNSSLQGFPRQGDKSGVPNFVYIERHFRLDEDLAFFHKVVKFKKLAILIDEEVLSLHELAQMMDGIAKALKFDYQFIPINQNINTTLAALGNSDAVFVSLSQHLNLEKLDDLATGLKAKNLPSFSMYGQQSLDKGFLLSFSSKNTLNHIARRIAVYVTELARGVPANDLNVNLYLNKQLYVNEALAKTLGISFDWEILNQAQLQNPIKAEKPQAITLKAAMEQAAQSNLEAVKQKSVVAAGKENIDIADSYWLPQVSVGVKARMIDSDTASFSFGTQSQYLSAALAQLRQLIYDESLWANRSIQRYLQEMRLAEQQTVLLDIRLKAAFAYLNVLRLEALEKIQKSNLTLTQVNLKNAKTRVSVGNADKSEIYRWESVEANNRQNLLTADADVKVAKTKLNQILNLPLTTELTLESEYETDMLLTFNQQLVKKYLNAARHLEKFQKFMVRTGLEQAPEILAISHSVDAQDRQLTAKKRAMYLPTVEVVAGVEQNYYRGGKGIARPTDFDVDRNDVRVGIELSLPLLTGGRQLAEVNQNSYELQRLKTESSIIDQLVEQRIRNAISTLQASYPGILLAKDAAIAAANNLKIVDQAYQNGMVPIITLLDAQQSLLTSEQASANANYKFLMDLIEFQRSLGDFNAFYSKEFQASFMVELENYLTSH
jgi:outer membrane protein TolC